VTSLHTDLSRFVEDGKGANNPLAQIVFEFVDKYRERVELLLDRVEVFEESPEMSIEQMVSTEIHDQISKLTIHLDETHRLQPIALELSPSAESPELFLPSVFPICDGET
jgi:hypothetical protein